jgi:predicted transcriptional regulator
MSNTSTTNSERFLKAFSEIEKHLKRKCGIDQYIAFYQLVTEASKKMPEARKYQDDLKEYGDLRNAIVHERAGGYVIAEPNDFAVDAIEKIKTIISKPPRVIPLFQREVMCFDINDSIGHAVRDMAEKLFSQIPISSNGKFKALLSTNTVSRWLGFNFKDDVFSLTETKIGEVLKFAEDYETYRFINRTTSLFDVLEYFDSAERQGNLLDALLITDDGNKNKKIIGIITITDFPSLLRQISL